jgi:hypothetical protein
MAIRRVTCRKMKVNRACIHSFTGFRWPMRVKKLSRQGWRFIGIPQTIIIMNIGFAMIIGRSSFIDRGDSRSRK